MVNKAHSVSQKETKSDHCDACFLLRKLVANKAQATSEKVL